MALPRYDFTERQIFSKNASINEAIFFRSIGFTIPWKFYELKPIRSDADLEEGWSELFFTGSKEDILRKKEYKRVYMSGNYCERCGIAFRRLPWEMGRRYPYLCEECGKDLDREFGKDMFGMKLHKREIENPWWLV